MREREEGQRPEPQASRTRRYVLPVDALVLLSEVGQVCFSARLTTLPGQARGSYQIRLILRAGTVAACQILRADGTVLLAGSPALQMVRELGDLTWSLDLSDPPERGPTVGPAGKPERKPARVPEPESEDWSGLIPRRGRASPAFHRLPPRVRWVLNLVDGQRTLTC